MRNQIETLFLALAICGLQGCSKGGNTPPTTALNASSATAAPNSSAPDKVTEPLKKKLTADQAEFSKSEGATRPAAFGYYYGISPSQIEQFSIDLDIKHDEFGLKVATTNSAPAPWGEADSYALVFFEDKLIKITAIGRDILNDSAGLEGKKKFKETKDVLIEKYGKPSDGYTTVGNKLFQERNEFYECLAYDGGCGLWFAGWKTPERRILLQLNGGRKKGYLSIQYEAPSEWDAAQVKIEATKKAASKKGL